MLLLQRCELHTFLTAGQNTLDQITRRRRLFCPISHIVFKVKNFFESLKYYYDRQSNQQISGITLCHGQLYIRFSMYVSGRAFFEFKNFETISPSSSKRNAPFIVLVSPLACCLIQAIKLSQRKI